MNKKIPKPKLNNSKSAISLKKSGFQRNKDSITFSFEALKTNEYFNLNGTCQNWTNDLIKMLKDVSSHSANDLLQNKFKTYRVHNHKNAKPPCDIPNGIELKDFYQIRISSSKGGIHGVFYENIFYIVWLDPLHNMYPDDRYGGLRKITPPNTCCMDRETEIVKLKEELEKYKKDVKDYKEMAEYLEQELKNKEEIKNDD